MIGEALTVTAEVAKEAVKETAKEAAKGAVKEAGKQAAKETANGIGKSVSEKIDISKRIDINKKPGDPIDRIDIRKRITSPDLMAKGDVIPNNFSETIKEYIDDLKSKSEYPDTIKNRIDPNNIEISSPDRVKQLREEFDDMKSDLRKEWERINNKEWPRYKEDICNSNEIRIRKAGDCYDAHHVQPLQLGGKNEATNITPLGLDEHKAVHSKTGSCTKMVEKVIEGGR